MCLEKFTKHHCGLAITDSLRYFDQIAFNCSLRKFRSGCGGVWKLAPRSVLQVNPKPTQCGSAGSAPLRNCRRETFVDEFIRFSQCSVAAAVSASSAEVSAAAPSSAGGPDHRQAKSLSFVLALFQIELALLRMNRAYSSFGMAL